MRGQSGPGNAGQKRSQNVYRLAHEGRPARGCAYANCESYSMVRIGPATRFPDHSASLRQRVRLPRRSSLHVKIMDSQKELVWMVSDTSRVSRSRRDLLKSLAAVGSAAALMAKGQDAAQGRPHLTFPTEPRQRLSVTSWPFRAYIEKPGNKARETSKPGMDLKEFAATVMQR